MNDLKGGVAKVTCPAFEAMGQIPAFHRTYFLLKYFTALRRRNLQGHQTDCDRQCFVSSEGNRWNTDCTHINDKRCVSSKVQGQGHICCNCIRCIWDGVGKRSYIMPKRNDPGVSVQHRGRLAVGRIIIMYAAAEVSD